MPKAIVDLMKQTINVTINGRLYREDVEPRLLLSHFLRETVGLTGTHVGCVVGECGACTVLLDGKLVKSCLHFAVQADGREVTTVEGLAKDGELSVVQEAFVKHYAFQCGYCTPGMIMASYALLRDHPNPSEGEIRKALSGNLCMCTGYVQIVEAVKDAAEKQRSAKQ
jgi:aerobic carbon-monoxide dehydrogenase small subunit